jgi:hypothetical protein
MKSTSLNEFIASSDYEILDVIDLLKFDHDLPQLYQRLKKLKQEYYSPNQRIVILHNDHEYFYHNNSTGFNTHNLFTIIRELDIPLFVFFIITNHAGYENSITPFINSTVDMPEIHNPLMHDLSYRMLTRRGVFDSTPDKDIQYHALCMLGTARSHRVKLYQFFKSQQLENQIKFTFAAPNIKLSGTEYPVVSPDSSPIHVNDLVYSYPHRINESWCNNISDYPELKELNQIVPEVTTCEYIDAHGANFYNQFAIDIVTETVFDYPYVNITEKTFRPMVMLTPFVIVGSAGVLKHLKSFGIKTFHGYWNEDYDQIQDPRDRFIAVTKIIQQICSLPLVQIKELYADMLPILEHNREVVLNYAGHVVSPLYKKLGVFK